MVTTLDTVGNQWTEKIWVVKVKDIFTALSLLGLLAACAPISTSVVGENPTNHTAIHDNTTQRDHNALARHFEDTAKEMQAKADEQKKLLKQYEKEPRYGWQSHNSKSHTLALIRKYEQAARSNMKEAASHRQMAQKPKHDYATHGGEMAQSRSN
jgi:hypothetical protein